MLKRVRLRSPAASCPRGPSSGACTRRPAPGRSELPVATPGRAGEGASATEEPEAHPALPCPGSGLHHWPHTDPCQSCPPGRRRHALRARDNRPAAPARGDAGVAGQPSHRSGPCHRSAWALACTTTHWVARPRVMPATIHPTPASTNPTCHEPRPCRAAASIRTAMPLAAKEPDRASTGKQPGPMPGDGPTFQALNASR